ncbi:MAG: hypothetical protein H6835_06110 [Planctomycetes bacterium]|nr:hypothetical protein [Planctomycetota bacterium]
MVIHRVQGGHGGALRPRRFVPFATLTLLVTSLVAPRAAAQEPAAAPAAAPVFGKIVVDEAPLRCWSGAVQAPPVFEDVLKKDQIVQLGRTENGFRCVILPVGPVGYVSQRFCSVADDGTVATKGTKVAFRYRPRTTEAPVAQLPDGTPVLVVGEHEDWFKARVPGVDAWVAAAEVQELDGSDPAVQARWAAFEQAQRGEGQARLDAIAAERAQQQQDRADLEAVKVVEDAFAKELAKPAKDQQLEPLKGAIAKLDATLVDKSAAKPALAALAKRIDTQKWIVDAMNFSKDEPVIEPQPAPVQSKDRLERFDSIGWLRYESRLAGPGVFYLEKGGRRQHVLTCNTYRYDLALFVGREVGVIGPRRQPPGDALSQLDVERLEVLSSSSR